MSVGLLLLAGYLPAGPDPIGCERIPCECTEWPCTDCSGLGYIDEPLFPADFDVGLDSLRAELDPSYQEPGR